MLLDRMMNIDGLTQGKYDCTWDGEKDMESYHINLLRR